MFSPRLILQTKVIILLYSLDFVFNREQILDAPSSYKNNKNAVAEDQTHVQNILSLSYFKPDG